MDAKPHSGGILVMHSHTIDTKGIKVFRIMRFGHNYVFAQGQGEYMPQAIHLLIR